MFIYNGYNVIAVMTVHLFCITANGGLPLFTRKKGEGDPLPFSIVASLNGVHMFSKSQDVVLKSTSTQDTTFIWEEFEKSIILVAAASCSSEGILLKLLHAVYSSMLMFVGVEEIRTIRNPDRLKRDLRVCFPLIDKLMDGADANSFISCSMNNSASQNKNTNASSESNLTDSLSSACLLGYSEAILCHESNDFMTCLDAYGECMDSQFACLLVCGREAVSTSAWCELHPLERQLLTLLSLVSSPCTSSDTPVFLPFKSPSIPFRLVWVLLVPGVSVLALCGPTPGLSEAEHLALQCWSPIADHLRATTQIIPRNIPHAIHLESSILGFLLLRTDVGKYVLSCTTKQAGSNHQQQESSFSPAPSTNHRLHILRTFYYQAAESLLLASVESKDLHSEGQDALEVYWCSEYHKCYGLRHNNTVLCVLYTSSVPTHTLRLITQQTLKILSNDKLITW